jgi:hypothetical protein
VNSSSAFSTARSQRSYFCYRPDELNPPSHDAIAFSRIAGLMDQFDEAVPVVSEIDGYHDRELALIEGERTG